MGYSKSKQQSNRSRPVPVNPDISDRPSFQTIRFVVQDPPLPLSERPATGERPEVRLSNHEMRLQNNAWRLGKWIGRFIRFWLASTLLTVGWYGTIHFYGSISGNAGLDNVLYSLGVLFFFAAYMSGFADQWAARHCMFAKTK